MELSVIACYFVAVLLGFIIGLFLSRRRKTDGVLKVDVSDPKRDKYLMEFHIPLDEIPARKHVYLSVVNTVENP